tara:strand:- start:340 stop:816 length:477 start_codon:yes stop_codon:yes gene_type:complete
MSHKLKKSFYLSILSISIFTIFSALYIEYVLSIPVCKLCLYQRIPYIFSIVICFFGYFFSNNKLWSYFLLLIFLISATISGYHIGIENNIFKEFSGCTSNNLNIIDKDELLQNLNNNLQNCKDVNFRIFGLSLATINFILSIALTLIVIKYLQNEKNK